MNTNEAAKAYVEQALVTLRGALRERGVDALYVTHPANVRYLTGFSSPKDASVLVLPDRAVMFTDGRYTAQAAEEALVPYEITSEV
ncbi:MAG TPA: aminopeptidase P family N-terminal domain-containing protein, partial [Trueperaceae bacterium]|nr:aminopeptidase P family N-terminal domain-containing protein [Trueperaceae bacterium]